MSINSSTWVHIMIYMEIHGNTRSYMAILGYIMGKYTWEYIGIIRDYIEIDGYI